MKKRKISETESDLEKIIIDLNIWVEKVGEDKVT